MTTCANTQNPLSGEDILLQIGSGFAGDAAADITTNAFTATAHGMEDGDPVVPTVLGTVTGITADTTYYVRDVTANTFKLAATRGGTAIDLTGANDDVTFEEGFESVGGLQSASIALAASVQEITNKLSNKFRELLDASGIKTMTLSGNGVALNDHSASMLRLLFQDQSINRFRCLVDDEAAATLKYWEGCFKITALEFSGDTDAPQNFSVTLESSGSFSYNEV